MNHACCGKDTPLQLSRAAALVLLVLAVLVTSCGGNDEPENSEQPSSNQGASDPGLFIDPAEASEVLMEAEAAVIEPPMIIKRDEGPTNTPEVFRASGGKYVNLPDKPGKEGDSEEDQQEKDNEEPEEKAGRIIFNFEIEKADKYRLWARVNWLDGCGNSFNVVMDGGPAIMLGDDGTHKVWQWVNIRGKDGQFRLAKGMHALEFRNREDGASLDRVLLTTNRDQQAQPQGIRAP